MHPRVAIHGRMIEPMCVHIVEEPRTSLGTYACNGDYMLELLTNL